MSLNINFNNLTDTETMLYKKTQIIQRNQLPERPFDRKYNSNKKYGIIASNSNGNNDELQEFAQILSQLKSKEAVNDKKIKVVSTAAKADNTDDEEEHTTSDKSTPTDVGSTLAKEGLYRLTGSELLKPNPYLVAMTLLGVDFEEDGDALKKGAETGEIGDFKGDYENYFKNMWDRADTVSNAAWEGLNMPANVISIGLQDCLQTIGMGLSKVLGKKPIVFIGSGVSAVGTAFNAIGDIAGESINGTIGVVKNLFTLDFDGVADSVLDICNGVKDSVVDVANSVADFANDGVDTVVDAGEKVADVAKDAGNAIADVAEDAGDAIADAAGEVGDFAEDAWDEVEDFFSGIF